jgi:hypothetical protein
VILPLLAKAITEKLPGNAEKPAPVRLLPEANMLPLGISFWPKDALGIKGLGPAAMGFYKDGEKRYRVLEAAPADEAAAKAMLKSVRDMPGTLPVSGLGDEELTLDAALPLDKQNATRLTKDEKTAKLKSFVK